MGPQITAQMVICQKREHFITSGLQRRERKSCLVQEGHATVQDEKSLKPQHKGAGGRWGAGWAEGGEDGVREVGRRFCFHCISTPGALQGFFCFGLVQSSQCISTRLRKRPSPSSSEQAGVATLHPQPGAAEPA